MINNADAVIAAERNIFTFRLGAQVFGIDMRALTEIREWEEPTPLPGVPAYIRGVTNLRGTVMPIVDLSERLGWSPTRLHPRSCIVVAATSGGQAGFLVDEVADIVPVRESDIQAPPSLDTSEDGVIVGLVQVADARASGAAGTVALLSLDALNVTGEAGLAERTDEPLAA